MYVTDFAAPAACLPTGWVTDSSSVGERPAWPAVSAAAARGVVTCVAVVAACAWGDMQTAAAMPATAGAAARDSRRLRRVRDVVLWLPKGFLPEQDALTGKAAWWC